MGHASSSLFPAADLRGPTTRSAAAAGHCCWSWRIELNIPNWSVQIRNATAAAAAAAATAVDRSTAQLLLLLLLLLLYADTLLLERGRTGSSIPTLLVLVFMTCCSTAEHCW